MDTFKPQATIQFYHPTAFWLGTAAVLAGVFAHIPMFINAAEMNFHMAGMQMSALMVVGMYAIVFGTVLAGYGVYPRGSLASESHGKYGHVHAHALDDTLLTPMHWKLIGVLLIALIVDVMKPATLGFVIPGTAAEYGLTKAQVATLPLAGLGGTVLGSFAWGYLGDMIGRRASILLAAMIFIGTSICGAMPSYHWNVFMCFIMGWGAGGMLPIAFALLAEIVPAKQRGWLVVLLGGIGTIGGYLAASGCAALLEPIFGWRIMWFLGLPTGVLLLILNRYIPESPRYLMVHGNKEEADRVMRRFGIELVEDRETEKAPLAPSPHAESPIKPGSFAYLFKKPFTGLTWGLGLYGFAWGMVNFGFLLWLPSNLRDIGMTASASDAVLAKSAFIAFPAAVLVAWLYHKWSTKGTMILFAILTAASLGGFAMMGAQLADEPWIMSLLLVSLLVSSSGVIAMLSPYTAEVYPAQVRATGSGWSAGASKLAGVATLLFVLAGLIPGLTMAAIIVAIPTLLSALLIAQKGIETRGQRIQELY